MSNDSSENPVDETVITGSRQYPTEGGPSFLPWVLFGISSGVLVAITIVLLRQVSLEKHRADEEAQAHAQETGRLDRATMALGSANVKVEGLEKDVASLKDERDGLAVKLKAAEDGANKAPVPPKTTTAPTTKKTTPAKKTASTKKPPKKKTR